MIIVNKTRDKILSHHRRGVFLAPGTNTLDDATITKSERAFIDALVRSRFVEILPTPEPMVNVAEEAPASRVERARPATRRVRRSRS